MRFVWSLLAGTALLLTGCSVSQIAKKQPVTQPSQPAAVTPLHGVVHGGQQAIQTASVYLFTVYTTAYGHSSNSKLTGTGHSDGQGRFYVQTNSSGVFSIPAGEYSCNPGDQVYLYSVGGNAGFGTNSAAGLMAVLGQCGNANTIGGLPATIQMNEVTTVAAAYALAGYATDATDISGDQTAEQSGVSGLANAAANAANLVSLGNGVAGTATLDGNGVTPQAEINTLADILAACINSAGPPSSASCTTLFNNAKSAGSTGTTATDTATAAIYIAHNPGANVPALFALAAGTPPFQPILGAAPGDWTLAITYSHSSLNGVSFVAVDATGDVWITNNDGNSITEIVPIPQAAPTGAVFSTTQGGLSGPNGVAVDTNANIWVANGGQGNGNSISEFTNSLDPVTHNVTGISAVSTTGYIGGGVDDPWGVAIDPNNNVWVANFDGNSISEYIPGTGYAAGDPITDPNGNLDSPLFIAADPYGNLWVTNTAGGGATGSSIEEYTPGTGFVNFTDASLYDPVGVAIDAGNNIWIANELENDVTSVNYFYNDQIGSYSGGGLSRSDGIAIDGASRIWISNYGTSTGFPAGGNTVTELNNDGTPVSSTNGFQYQSGNLTGPQGIAVDPSGNVWIANNGANTVTELVGAATPVITPIAAAVQAYALGTQP